MDVRELRIGNWVYDGTRTQFPMYVTGFSDGYVTLNFNGNEGMDWEADAADLMPIPLKGSLLEQLGFTFYGSNRYELEGEGWTIIIHPHTPITRIEHHDKNGDYFATVTSEKIRTLHDLQNAFYITTKQELKVNL